MLADRFRTALTVLAAGVIAASVAWVSGYSTGQTDTRIQWDAEKAQTARQIAELKAAHTRVLAQTSERLEARLSDSKEHHARIQSDLRAALRDSELRRAALSRDLVRLHDAAAAGPGPAADTPGPADGSPGEAPTAADLVDTCLVNYEIANRNAERLAAWQSWWRSVSSVGDQ